MPAHRPITILLATTFGLLLALAGAVAASPRDSKGDRTQSFEFYGATIAPVGSLVRYAQTSYTAKLGADSLFTSSTAFGFEYAESIGKVSLATGLEFGSTRSTRALRRSLGITDADSLSARYLDIPITYRIHALTPNANDWNFSLGLSLPIMIDFLNSTQNVFLSSGDSVATDASSLVDKHVDFGLGFGGEIGVERRISSAVFLTARLRYRTPISGVTRPTQGFAVVGLKLIQF